MQKEILRTYYGKLKEYTELRAHENRARTFQLVNGQLTTNQETSEGGLSARVFAGSHWGFASLPELNANRIEKVLKDASDNAHFLSRAKNKSHASLFSGTAANGSHDYSTKKTRLTTSMIVDYMKAIDSHIQKNYSGLATRIITIQQQDFEKDITNSSGARAYSLVPRSYLRIRMGMDSPNGPVDIQEILGGRGQLEDTLPEMKVVESLIAEAFIHLKKKAEGTFAASGMKEVILHSKLAGILAHEAIGHTTEADLVLGGSVAGDFLGKIVANPLVNLVDYAHTVNGATCPVPVFFDDEGTIATDTVIIENGILKNFMHSKESAAHFGHKATGHARAWGFNDEPLIRMRNTAILPGRDKLNDMIASVEDGYYLLDHGNGQADSTSEFMFGVTLGYEIKKGKIGRAILDTTISGVAFDMLKSVTALSEELTWISSGTCGKKQPMAVGMGGPAMKCVVKMGGR